MLTNTTEIGTATLPRRRLTIPAPTDVSPSAPRRPPRFPALAWAALALLGLLAHPSPASAQTDVWTATFTTADLGSGILGCDNDRSTPSELCSTATVLSDDDFTHDSTDYSVIALFLSGGALSLKLDTDITTATAALTLVVGTTSLALADATDSTNTVRVWSSTGLSWTAGTAVSVRLTEPVTNNPPTVANAIPDQSATAGTAFSYVFPANTFSDADTGDTLSYTATKTDDTALPTWLSFAATTRTFSGTPQAADTRTVAVKVTASDGNGGSVSDEFDITVIISVPSNWTLKPTALAAGAKFRLLFLSSTKRDGSSSDIADYHAFIQTRAAAGHADIRTYSTGFRAVGCTADTDARDTTYTTYTSTDKGVPIYWLNGAKAADQYEDFYDGTWDDEANDKNESGTNGPNTSLEANYPLTGCNDRGTEYFDRFNRSSALAEIEVMVGRPNSSAAASHGPLSSNTALDVSNTVTRPMYGLSAIFQVAADTTPPTLTSADVEITDALIINLVFSEDLQLSNPPALSAFTVTVDGSAATVSSVGVPGSVLPQNELWLQLSTAIRQRQAVVVTYTDATSGDDTAAIQDTAGNDAATFTTGMDGVPAVTNNSTVTNTVPADWSLIPTGLSTGDKFRLLFLSSTKRTASSTDIADYNTFIQTRAAAGHTDIQDYSADFRAVGCTADTDARDNTKTTYTTTDKGVPIYWLNGAKAADQYEDFYDGSWDDEANDKNESGTNGLDTSQNVNYPWTGCDHDGTEAVTGGGDSFALGTGLVDARVGRPNSSESNVGPLNGQTNRSDFQNSPLYGLSDVFQVAAAVVVTNNPPTVANAIPDQSATAGTAFSYAFPANTFSDADTGDTLSYTATKADDTALPTWLAFDASTRTFSGTPQAADIATVAVKVTASDGDGGSVSDTFDITVAADPNAHCNVLDTSELWCGTLTVGVLHVAYGYNAGHSYGSVAPLTFTHGGATITVNGLFYVGTRLQFSMSSALGAGDFSLEIGTGGAKRSFAMNNPGIEADFFNHGLSWSANETVPVKLLLVNTPATGAPAITGTAQVGQTLTATLGDIADVDGLPDPFLTDANTSFQWIRVATDNSETDIGAMAGAYTLVADDQGTTIKVKVSFTGNNGFAETRTSAATAAVSATAAVVPANWSLKPTGRAAGDQFRLLFLSSTKRNGSSTDIATYNTFVQERAAAGHADIRTYSAGFRAVGCTSDVDARDNTRTTGTGVPIYWLNGAKAADNYADFYDGSWDDEVNDKNESGTNGPDTSQSVNRPFTGCEHNGTEALDGSISQGFGAAGGTKVGRPNSSSALHGPLSSNAVTGTANTRPLYGLSEVFQVAAAVVVPNNPPAFSADTAARSVAENTAAGQNVGAALTATDADSDTLTYTLEGTDAASFDIVSGSGQIRTRTGVTYNHEDKSTHTVVVKADDGKGGTDTVTVTITVTDVDEPPGQPAAPTVSATAGSTTSLDVTWTAPTNTGPAIASYDLQYRAGTSGNFTDGPQNVTGTSAAIGSLAADTSYQVQVRATNAEGDGDWSVAGTGRTTATSAPGAPTGLTATASGTTQINLSWSAPGSTGGSAITGYKIEVSPNGTDTWTTHLADTTNTNTTYAHTGLAASTTRHYRVSAINTIGTSAASNVDDATTGAGTNTAATGAPTITGTAQVGQTLTAVTTAIMDAEGLTTPGYTYQWIRTAAGVDTNISGATASTYTLVAADLGTTIKVRVSFTDDASNDETLTSAATAAVSAAPNTAATGAPTITGTAQVGQTLTAGTTGIMDADGLTNVSYTYQWIRVDGGTETNISGATASTHTLVAVDLGTTIKVTVSFTDDASNAETLTSAATAAVSAAANNLATGAPTITGTAQVGQTLTAGTTGIMDADGLNNVSYTYQWIRVDGGTETNISGATASTHTLVAADQGTTIKVRVSFTDDASNAETLTSTATAVVSAAPNTLPSASNGTVTTNEDTARTFAAADFNFLDTDPGDTLESVEIITLPASGTGTLALSGTPVTAGQEIAEADIGTLTYTPPANANGTGYASFTFKVSDGTAESAADYTMTITVTAVNDAPTVATAIPDQPATAGTAFSYAFPANTFSDADIGDTLTYAATKADGATLPTWMGFAAGTRTFSGTPQTADVGTVAVKVTASDGNGGSVSDTFDITVSAAGDTTPPTLTSATVFEGGVFINLQFSENMLQSNLPSTTTFTVTAAGSAVTVYTVQAAVAPAPLNAFWILVRPTIQQGQAVVVTYTDPTAGDDANAIQDTAGNDAATFTTGMDGVPAVTNNSITNTPATGAPTITGTATVGQTLTAVTTGIMDADGLTNVSYTYQWIRVDGTDADISGATSITYTLVGADLGKTIKVTVSFTDDASNPETLTSTATAAVAAAANTPATGAPAITGAAQVGQTLTAGTTAIMDANGLNSVNYMYQWIRVDGGAETNISGATSITYTLVGADLGKTIKVKVSFTDDASNPETLTSTATTAVAAAANTPATGAPAITGAAQVGQTLTAGTTAIMDANGLTSVSYTYQWIRVATDNTETNIASATASTYTLVAADQGTTIKVKVSFTDDASNAETLTSAATAAVAAAVPNNPPAFSADTAARSVAENTAAGQNVGGALTATDADSDTLTYTLEGADAASFDIVSGSGQIRTKAGVTYNHEAKSTYTVIVKADDGNGGTDTIAVTITVTDVDEPPGRPAAPTVSATTGSTTSLDVTWTAPTNTGPAIASYDLQYRAGTSGNFTNGPQNVTGTSAAIGSLAADTSYEVQVRATNAEGDGDWSVAGTGRTTATSAPGAPTGLTATASGATQIDLSWSAPGSTGGSRRTDRDGGGRSRSSSILRVARDPGSAITGYRIEVSSNGGSSWTNLVANTGNANTTYAHTGLTAGTTRHYRVSAINANGTGVPSNVANATTGATAPGAPTGLTATASGTTAINLSWSAPASTGGAAITGYRIEVSSNGTSSWTNLVANTSNTTTTYAHTGLTAGATRHYRVSAINANGAGTASNVANATTGQTTVTFGASSYTAAEGGATATVAVQLSAAASATVTIPLTKTHRGGATAADYSGVPSNVTFTAGQTRRTFTVTATDDADTDGGESVQLGFGTLPGGYAPGARRTATVTLVDDDATLIVNFGTERHTTVKVRESDTVWHRFIFSLSTSRYGPPNGNPQQPVTIPLVVTHRGGTTTEDYEGIPSSVTFAVGESVTSFRMRAIPDGRKETGEGLRLDFGPLPAGVRKGTWGPYETIAFVDQVLPGYTVLFGAEAYTATEGGAPARVSIHLSEPVEIEPLVVRLVVTHVGATAADYTGIPKSVRFGVGEQTQTITVKATDDTDDDDGESVTLSFVNDPNGRVRVRTGPASATVALADNDGPRRVTVSFGAVTYTATEGGADATVRVELDAAPGRSVTVPLTKAHLGNATAADYSGIPMNVTFAANQTSRTFAVMATAGDGSDGGESVSIGFGTLPEGVFAGSPAATTVTLADGGEQRLVVNFGSSRGHTVQVREGARRLRLNVLLDSSPRRPLTIPLVVTHVGGATEADYAAIPESVTFAAGQTSAHYYVRALPDEEDETGEGLQLDFGPLPPGVRKGTWGPYETIAFVDAGQTANLSVAGPVLTLDYPWALDGGSTPSPRDFVVSVEAPGGEKAMAPVAAVAVEGSDVFLQLARPVAPDDTVTLSYLADAMHPIRGEAGSPAAPLTDAPVRNQTPASGLGPEAGLRVQAANPAPLAALLEAAQVGAGTGRLDLSSRHLTDITALAGLTGLRELDLRDNAIEDLWPLAGLRGLEALYLSGNQISDLRPLAGLRGLKVLDLAGNRIEDLWPLSGLTELRELDLADNAVADLGPLAGLAGLEALDLAGNRISDVWGPGYLTRLERLNLADNAIEDLRPLARLTRLEVLLLDRNRITDVLALSPMAELANLGLAGNPIANLWPLAGLGRLHRLDLAGNAVADPSALGRVENLRWLWLDPETAARMEALPPPAGRVPAPLRIEPTPGIQGDGPGPQRAAPGHKRRFQ